MKMHLRRVRIGSYLHIEIDTDKYNGYSTRLNQHDARVAKGLFLHCSGGVHPYPSSEFKNVRYLLRFHGVSVEIKNKYYMPWKDKKNKVGGSYE